MDERLERHLCNLHNEVFEAAESRINTEVPSLYVRVYRPDTVLFGLLIGSLTIREGISFVVFLICLSLEFPHYT